MLFENTPGQIHNFLHLRTIIRHRQDMPDEELILPYESEPVCLCLLPELYPDTG